jgi:hypothetical protein
MRVSSEPIEPPDFESGRIVALGSQIHRAELSECVRRAIEVGRR